MCGLNDSSIALKSGYILMLTGQPAPTLQDDFPMTHQVFRLRVCPVRRS
jgi:hypothetical protein